MIARISAITLVTMLSASVVACGKPGEQEQNAEGRANKQAEETQSQAAQQAAAAQAEADQKIAAARADFEKSREGYRHSRQSDLDALDEQVADLEAKAHTATGQKKAALDASLPGIHAQRDAFVADMKSLQVASPATWDAAKTRLDNEWEALKASVSKVS